MQPPWADVEPAPAPGGAFVRKNLSMLKHTLLFFSVEHLQLLGTEVDAVIKQAVPGDRQLVGAVARPNYYCSSPRPLRLGDGSTIMVPCGKTVPLSPLLQLVVDNEPTRNWICDKCRFAVPAPGGAKPVRCLLLDPMLKARGSQGKKHRCVPHMDSGITVELIVALEPDPWVVSVAMPAKGRLHPKTVHVPGSTKTWCRAVYSEEESADVWQMATRLPQ
jgi:hypothetical protein